MQRSTRRLLLLGGAISAFVACVFVPTATDLPASDVNGYLNGSFSVSWSDPKVILYNTTPYGGGDEVLSCFDPKWDAHRGHHTLPSDVFIEEIADDPSTSGSSTVQWAVGTTGYGLAWAMAFDEWCSFEREIQLAYPPLDTVNRVIAGYDVGPDGTHYALFYDQLYGGGLAWRVARHDNIIVGQWDEVTVGALAGWSTPAIDGVQISIDPAGDLIVGNEERLHLDPTTLAVTGSSTLQMPGGYTMQDFTVHEDYTIALIDGASDDKLVLFDPNGQLDADAEASFTWATGVAASIDTANAGTANDGCGTILKVEVMGARPYSEDPGNHRAHQFWWALEDCDPYAAGDPGF